MKLTNKQRLALLTAYANGTELVEDRDPEFGMSPRTVQALVKAGRNQLRHFTLGGPQSSSPAPFDFLVLPLVIGYLRIIEYQMVAQGR